MSMGWQDKLRETARKNRVELIDAGLTRRDLFKLGLLTSAGYLVAKVGLSSRAAVAKGVPSGPPTTPWVEELPIPPVATPVPVSALGATPTQDLNRAAGEQGRIYPHQHWEFYDPPSADHYLIENKVTMVSWHRELPPDECWLFNSIFPGPHPRTPRPRDTGAVSEPAPDAGPAQGLWPADAEHAPAQGHQGSESDGNPLDTMDAGAFKDHLFLNRCAGFTDPVFGIEGDPRETMSTQWYHDHCIDFTAQNVYRGNAGVYYQFGRGHRRRERSSPEAWRLPSGDFDVPLVLHDRVFDSHGKGFYDLFNLTASSARSTRSTARSSRSCASRAASIGSVRRTSAPAASTTSSCQRAEDGAGHARRELPRPMTVKGFRIAVAQRVDAIIDFSTLPSGTELYLVNCQEQDDGRGPTGKVLPVSQGDKVLKLIVDGTIDTKGDPSRIPDKFFDLPDINRNEVVTERTFVFDRQNGGWSVNGRQFNPDRITANPRLGTAEIWNFVNNSGGWMHPVHIHMEEHRQISRNGKPPLPDEIGREDVVWLGHGESVKTFRRFRDFTGRYVAHCHNVVHEDHAMMFQWNVVP
jgi:FtsP/CotA-like multicopper oxidase with cupredoxin domain